jgi:hypothetical protein
MFRHAVRPVDDMAPSNEPYSRQGLAQVLVPHSESPGEVMMHNKNFLSSNILLSRILERRNASRIPVGLNIRNFYSNLDLMTIKWAASLNQRMSMFTALDSSRHCIALHLV